MKSAIMNYLKNALICSTAISIVSNAGCVRLEKEQLTEISKMMSK